MTDLIVSGLIRKRAEIAGEYARAKRDLAAIDRALEVFGYFDAKAIKPRETRRRPALFAPGELTALVGRAERAGCADNASIAAWIMQEREFAPELAQRVRSSVKDCRKPKRER